MLDEIVELTGPNSAEHFRSELAAAVDDLRFGHAPDFEVIRNGPIGVDC